VCYGWVIICQGGGYVVLYTVVFLLPLVQAKVTLTTEGTEGGGVTCLAFMKRRSLTAAAIKLN
jgi:hypothetical protein